jgi:formate dehydrogenase iron-sulfur subunit
MAEYIKLIDVTKCTGCRGCQVACKQWNELPAEQTMFTGSLQNPKDLGFNTWCLIRFDEVEINGTLKWLMRHDACMHCEDPACAKACPSPGALVKTDEGPVLHDPKYCIGCKACSSACPFDVPRHNKAIEKMAKCSMCYDRVTEGRIPACATACPTGAITFGPKEKMTGAADKRADKIGGYVYPSNPKYETHMLYVFPKDVKVTDFSHANPNPKMPLSLLFWKNLFKPLSLIGIGGVAGAAFLHYIIKGPHKVHEKKEEGGE